ncbi:hypothetical protein ABZ569_25845 [Streptomyces albus]|uniref:hypothetical protein n=1 Tax=Streptomyces albus TaxID=1888 RepID=UPI0033DE0B9F
MPYDDREHPHPAGHDPYRTRRTAGTHGGGIPDGLLVGSLAFLLGLCVFVWTATGLAGLMAHGAWPNDVTFANTPVAIRELVTEPHDIKGAWPNTPPGQLSGYGLFWGIFISQLMVLVVLTVFVMATVARARAVRKARRLARRHAHERAGDSGREHPTTHTEPHSAGTATAPGTGTASTPPDPRQSPDGLPQTGTQPEPPCTAQPVPPPAAPATPATTPPGTATEQQPPAPTPRSDPPTAVSPLLGAMAAAQPRRANSTPLPGNEDDPQPAAYDPVTRILEAPGAVLVASPTPDLWAATKAARAKLGPVHVFDPTHACDTPDRLRWSPHHGCADRATAAARATALLAPLRSPRPIDATVHTTAETMLRCWLHAAALEKRPFKEVHRWALATTPTTDAVRILRTHPKSTGGAAGELEAALAGHPQLRADAEALIRRALAPLGQLHVRNACSAERSDRLALESFIDEAGTLYVVGADPDVLPILNALTQSVVEHGRRMAARSSDGRLDPPLTTIQNLTPERR